MRRLRSTDAEIKAICLDMAKRQIRLTLCNVRLHGARADHPVIERVINEVRAELGIEPPQRRAAHNTDAELDAIAAKLAKRGIRPNRANMRSAGARGGTARIDAATERANFTKKHEYHAKAESRCNNWDLREIPDDPDADEIRARIAAARARMRRENGDNARDPWRPAKLAAHDVLPCLDERFLSFTSVGGGDYEC